MKFHDNVDLQAYNTLAVPSRAQYFCIAETVQDVVDALSWAAAQKLPLQILAGGSNVILPDFVRGVVLKPSIQGREIIEKAETHVIVRFGAGELWHQTVVWCMENGFYGLENLALIPGTVGASPVQNIGAYGVEICQFVESVEYIDRITLRSVSLSSSECEFSYRDSIFKHILKNRAVITYLTLKLPTQIHQNHQDRSRLYPALLEELDETVALTPYAIFNAVCSTRQKKLPDPATLPNCGSFFKNPIVEWAKYQQLDGLFSAMPSYPAEAPEGTLGRYRKLAAAWLIDQAGWKGKTKYGVCVHTLQALVVTNPNRCSSDSVLQLATDIKNSVYDVFGVTLELEPQLID